MSYRSPFLVIAGVIAGCYTGSAVDTNAMPYPIPTTDTDPTEPQSEAGSNIHGLTHLPCDVEKLLERSCWDCHGTVPGYDATSSLVTYDDLTAAAQAIPNLKETDVCLIRMSSAKNPMPPEGVLANTDIAILQKWVDAGMPKGTCGEKADAGADASADASSVPVCSSGKVVSPTAKRQSALTNPGAACLGCHSTNEAPFTVAGTVYATAREPDDCVGESDVNVIVIDANGAAHTLAANEVGNFSATEDIPFPYRAMVVRGTDIREMQTPQTNGDCNGCHAETPQKKAPGRVMAPAESAATTKE